MKPIIGVNYGYLSIDGDAASISVEIDKKPAGTITTKGGPLKIKLPAGAHEVVLDADGRKAFSGKIDVPKGQNLPVHAVLSKSYPRGKAVALNILGAGLITGGVFLHLEAEKPLGQPHGEDVKMIFNISRYAAWGLGGLMVGLGVFYAIYDPVPDSTVKEDRALEFQTPRLGPL